jgi:signal peptidase I
MNGFARVAFAGLQGFLWALLLGYASLVALPRFTSLEVFVVRGGSMEPAISVGSIVVVDRSQRDLRVGDIVSFREPDGAIITHRIASKDHGLLTTRGDANRNVDLERRTKQAVIGTVAFALPLLGYLLHWLQLPFVFLALLLVTGGALVIGELRAIARELRRMRRREAVDGG